MDRSTGGPVSAARRLQALSVVTEPCERLAEFTPYAVTFRFKRVGPEAEPISGFDLSEVGGSPAEGDPRAWRLLWERGGFPRSYLVTDEELSAVWRDDFVTSFLERDVPQLGITIRRRPSVASGP